MLTFKVLQGSKVLADLTCTTDELEAGQSTALDCLSTDKYPSSYSR